MFTTLIIQPIFNLLSLIYALLPGHDFGVAIILFTVLARWALYPLLKKQLRNTKAMRELQPELKRIKQASKGNKQQESVMMMELYKEKEIKPLSQLGLMVVQVVIFLALFSGLNRVVKNPQQIIDFSYQPVKSLTWMKEVKNDISKFDYSFLGSIDLKRAASEKGKEFYFPAFVLVLGSALVQMLQIRQTLPQTKNSRKLRDILKDANSGKETDPTEVNALMTRNFAYIMPLLIFVLTIGFPGALALYWFVGGLIAYAQQSYLLQQDEFMMQEASAVVVRKKSLKEESSTTTNKTTTKKAKTSSKTSKKRRK